MNNSDVHAGAAVYSKPVLRIYDLFVVHFSAARAWRCDCNSMLSQYDDNIGRRHLDVGPGTGWYLEHSKPPMDAQITLMDLNPNSLTRASSRLGDIPHRTIIGNVLEPLPESAGMFDSIATNYLFHCVPGGWDAKGAAFAHLSRHLAPDGVLFGSTILGQGVQHNRVGSALMKLYNRRGVFHNENDDAVGLQRALEQHFADVMVTVIGTVALFQARQPQVNP